ncbi:enoyl-CoA hydratase-related protein [Janthinobacterium fluminis]|uniref:Enoyl-CoA hydratase-related protein n=1 Tax=Janthinobacterium fluminis TaxID=2987524 RepID=A0ABT5JW42_9BURK|nr:enoyl-CoA hydratase-related protein [Janthinobacterium fluminis]MDC8756645.1 enoyl-CoA hydratase-related protein [Janthinobacterium fluminis]
MIHYSSSATTHIASLHIEARAVNPLSRMFQRALGEALDRLEAQRPLAGVVVSFDSAAPAAEHAFAHLIALTPQQAGDCMAMLASYHQLLRRLETLGRTVVATLAGDIDGHALGLALACHRRYALRHISLSMAQVDSGLTPSGGALVRCVRGIGLRAALPLLTEGLACEADAARQAGLLHGVAGDAAQLLALARAAIAGADAPLQPWDAPHYRMPGGTPASAPLQALLASAPAQLRQRTGGHYPAPEAVLCAMVEGAQVDFASALLIEGRYFCHIAGGRVAKHLMRLNQLRRAAPARDGAFAAALRAAHQGELAQLRRDGLAPALINNAARAAGMRAAPPQPEPAAPAGAAGPPPSCADARDRLLYGQCAAALAALRRADAPTPAQADLLSVDQCGFPAFTGGALAFIAELGADAFGARAAALAARYGARFAPPADWQLLTQTYNFN